VTQLDSDPKGPYPQSRAMQALVVLSSFHQAARDLCALWRGQGEEKGQGASLDSGREVC
jgi:hypothetical protein